MNIQQTMTPEPLSFDLAGELEHGIRVGRLCRLVSKSMGLPAQSCYDLSLAGLLHDIGRLRLEGMNPKRNGEKLNIEQIRYGRMHADLGADYLKECGFPDYLVSWVRYHHENCDGSGYPAHLRRAKIPLGSKIIRVCNEYVSLTTDRVYRKAAAPQMAVNMMILESEFYDLEVFLAFLKVIHTTDFGKVQETGDILAGMTFDEMIELLTPQLAEERMEILYG